MTRCAAVEHAGQLEACAAAHRQARELETELERLSELASARESELGLLEHELAEIDVLDIGEEEYCALLARRDRLRGCGRCAPPPARRPKRWRPTPPSVPAPLILRRAPLASLQAAAGFDPELDALAERCVALSIETQDLAGGLRAYLEGVQAEEEDSFRPWKSGFRARSG